MTECYCDFEAPTVYSAKAVKAARKDHLCDECFRPIHAGEPYERVWGIWDSVPATFLTCTRCLNLREFVVANVPCFCLEHGNVIDEAISTAQHYHEPGNGLLFGAYRRRVLIERNR